MRAVKLASGVGKRVPETAGTSGPAPCANFRYESAHGAV